MSARVTVDNQIYERQGIKVVIDAEGLPRDVSSGEVPEPGEVVLARMGEPSFLVQLPYAVHGDEGVPDEIGLGLRRVAQRLYEVDLEGVEKVEGGMGSVEWVIGPFVHDGTLRLFIDTDGRGFDKSMIEEMAAVFVDELTPPSVDVYVTAAPRFPGLRGNWRSSAERATER